VTDIGLLHDVGKAIDRHDHVSAGLEALSGHITPRVAWFIEHHREGQDLLDGSLGVRARRRLETSANYEELKLLAHCDRKGRERGVQTPDLTEAIEYLRELARMCGE
jgi:HD superfamily phosphodiesterase